MPMINISKSVTFHRSIVSLVLAVAASFVPGMAYEALAADGPIRAVQQALKKDQFLFEEPSGKMDDATHAALKRFQIRRGLAVTGEIDTATLQALDSRPPGSTPPEKVNPQPRRRRRSPSIPKATVEEDRQYLEHLVASGEGRPEPGTPREFSKAPPPPAPAETPASLEQGTSLAKEQGSPSATAELPQPGVPPIADPPLPEATLSIARKPRQQKSTARLLPPTRANRRRSPRRPRPATPRDGRHHATPQPPATRYVEQRRAAAPHPPKHTGRRDLVGSFRVPGRVITIDLHRGGKRSHGYRGPEGAGHGQLHRQSPVARRWTVRWGKASLHHWLCGRRGAQSSARRTPPSGSRSAGRLLPPAVPRLTSPAGVVGNPF